MSDRQPTQSTKNKRNIPKIIPTRPVLRWHGGKWMIAPKIIAHFPSHRIYVEPFGGAGSVLLRKRRVYAEVYNDLDDAVVNLFRVLRSPRAGELIDALRLTPFARTEFLDADQTTDGARPRTEILWINPACVAARDGERARAETPLFAEAGG